MEFDHFNDAVSKLRLGSLMSRIGDLEGAITQREHEAMSFKDCGFDESTLPMVAKSHQRARLLFKLYGRNCRDTPAWMTCQSTEFCNAWAQQSTHDGIPVVALNRYGRGISTADEGKQLLFVHRAAPVSFDIEAHPTYTGESWSLKELCSLRDSFVRTMEQAMGLRQPHAARVSVAEARPVCTVRGRIVVEYEDPLPEDAAAHDHWINCQNAVLKTMREVSVDISPEDVVAVIGAAFDADMIRGVMAGINKRDIRLADW